MPINAAAPANATKAIRSEYSTKSWPVSSLRNVPARLFVATSPEISSILSQPRHRLPSLTVDRRQCSLNQRVMANPQKQSNPNQPAGQVAQPCPLPARSLPHQYSASVALCPVYVPLEPAAEPAALFSCALAIDQIPLMLTPALINNAAEANATKARSNVYSMRSWPCSSLRNCFKIFTLYTPFDCFTATTLWSLRTAFVISGSRSFLPDAPVETC